MKDQKKTTAPFFAKFLENQQNIKGGIGDTTMKYPSDNDEDLVKI